MILGFLINSAKNLKCLKNSEHSTKNKIKIFLLWVGIKARLTDKLFGLEISYFNGASFRFLFDEIFIKNEYFIKTNNESPVIFDCGANIGMATIFFKWLYPKSIVYSFEPDKETFEILKKNISQNNIKDVYIYNVAITNNKGRTDFFIGEEPGSLGMSALPNRMKDTKLTKVNTISLSSFIKREKINKIDLLKMDIEGSEDVVIKDLSDSDEINKINEILLEYHHNIGRKSNLGNFINMLEKNNFDYQLSSNNVPNHLTNKPQDIFFHFYKKVPTHKEFQKAVDKSGLRGYEFRDHAEGGK